jgi:succinate dehydrogenase / fumarate reductase cytochrome b subunit
LAHPRRRFHVIERAGSPKHSPASGWFANSWAVPSSVDPAPYPGRPRWLQLQALAGAVPLAGYLVLHLATQASTFAGAQSYARLTRAIDAVPGLIALEIALIYVPLVFHVGASLLALRERADAVEGGLAGPWGPRLQVASGAVLLLFLAFHFWQFRWRLWVGDLARSDFYPELCATLSSTSAGGVPLVAIAYLLGVAAAALHGAQGIHRLAVGWDMMRGRQRLLARLCGGLGLGLFLLGALIVIDLATGSVLIHLPG